MNGKMQFTDQASVWAVAEAVLICHLEEEAEDPCVQPVKVTNLYRSGDRESWFLPSQKWSCSFVGGKEQQLTNPWIGP